MRSLSLQFLAVALIGLAACKSVQSNTGSTQNQPTAQSVEKSRLELEAKETEPTRASEASASRSNNTTAAPRGMVAASVAFPTGDVNTSSILVEKIVPQEAQVGQVFTYETKVTNLADFTLDNVVVSETRDPNFKLTASEPKAASASGDRNEWNLGNMAPRSSRTIKVTGTTEKEQAIRNCVSVSYATALCTAIPVVAPGLRLAASGPVEILQCDELVYGYVVTNPGSGAAKNVVVNATLPEGLTVDGRNSFTKNVGTLEPGKSSNFEVKAMPSRTGRFEHVAKATATGDLKAEAQALSTTVRKPKFEIKMTGVATRLAGRDVTYDITIKNVGDGLAKNAILETTLPATTSLESSTPGAKVSLDRVSWIVGDLAAGKERAFQVKLATTDIGRITPRANVKAYCADPAFASFSTDLKGIPAILLEVVDLKDPIEVGSNLTYLVTVTNQGTAPATNVKIAIELPANVSYVKAGGATAVAGGALNAGRIFELIPLPVLDPKAEAAWRIEVKGEKPADAHFKVSMTSDQLTSPVDETEATTFYE